MYNNVSAVIHPLVSPFAVIMMLLLSGCTAISELGVSEKGKQICAEESRKSGNSFAAELEYKQCLKGITEQLAAADQERKAALQKEAQLTAEIKKASLDPVYSDKWKADKLKLESLLANKPIKECTEILANPKEHQAAEPNPNGGSFSSADPAYAHIRDIPDATPLESCRLRQRMAAQIASSYRNTFFQPPYTVEQFDTFEGWYRWKKGGGTWN